MAGAKEVEMPESLRCSFQRRLLFPQMSAEFRLHFHLLRFFLLWVGKEKPHMKIQRVHFEALRPLRGPLHQLRERTETMAESFLKHFGSQLRPQGQRLQFLRFPSPSILETLNFICVDNQYDF